MKTIIHMLAAAIVVLCASPVVSANAATAEAVDGGRRDPAAEPDCGSADECLRQATASDKTAAAIGDGYKRAFSLYERACEQGSARGCTRIAELLSSGIFVVRDEKRALGLFEKACSQGYVPACYPAGHLNERGSRTPGAFTRDFTKAATFFEKGCSLGEGGCCHSLAALVHDGKGVKKDERRAAALRKRAKALGFEIPD